MHFSSAASCLLSLFVFASPLLALPVLDDSPQPANETLEERAFCAPTVLGLKGTVYKRKQVTDKVRCNKGSCEAGTVTQFTFGLTGSGALSGSLAGGIGSIGAELGIGVTAEWTNGGSINCAGAEGETVCQWQMVAYTVLEVQPHDGCSGGDKRRFEIRAPNVNNRCGEAYCVRGACRENGAEYWEGMDGNPPEPHDQVCELRNDFKGDYNGPPKVPGQP